MAHPEGGILAVKAQPGARKNAVLGMHNGMLKLAVTAPPERGKANKALVELLAKALGLRRSQVCLMSGESGTEKRFLVRGVTVNQLELKLANLID